MVTPADLAVAAQAWVVVLAAALLVLSLAAYRRSGRRRMLLLSLAFGLFLAKGLLAAASLFGWAPPLSPLLAGPAFLDTAVLLAVYLAALRPG